MLKHFEALKAANAGRLTATSSWEGNNANQAFFEWQADGGWDAHFAKEREIAELTRFMHYATDIYLQVGFPKLHRATPASRSWSRVLYPNHAFLPPQTIGMDEEQISQRSHTLHAWATVTSNGSYHLSHTHPASLVSGVYYVDVPADAGPILFRDPRGPRPPFDAPLTIHPRSGELLLFPSWLSHEVAPTPGAAPRISIAFNMVGEWADTASVRSELPLEAAGAGD